MTRQARSSAVIMGFDTHMILKTVPVLPPNARTCTRPLTGHHTTMPGPWGARHGTSGQSTIAQVDYSELRRFASQRAAAHAGRIWHKPTTSGQRRAERYCAVRHLKC
jgi:hypothetical protein